MKKIITLCLSIVLASCYAQSSKKLDQKTAMELIRKNYKEFCKAEVINRFSGNPNSNAFKNFDHHAKELEKQGLVTIRRWKSKNGNHHLKLEYTDLASKKYEARMGVYSIKVAVQEFYPMKILGISHTGSNKAEVLSSGFMGWTQFNTIVGRQSRCRNSQDVERKVTLTRYDSGWRLDK